ncbi:MAG: sensor histidine kinase [Spirochaetales bacterium]|nr:sensor histidine kinase [Spirochaetales bacterium]
MEKLFIDISKTIPDGWQFPEDIRCKVIFGNKEYVSRPFVQTLLRQRSRLYSKNEIIGQIEIYYIGIWEDTNTPFIQEEQNLLDLIALSLSEAIEHKQREEKICYLLKEKELILKEVHHRIKNNMGTIISLLSLQSGNMESPEAVGALETAANRIHSMLILYDKLYRGTDFQSISVKDYLTTLTEEIVDNFETNNRIKVETDIEDFELNSKTIFNLGIITNELITNSMKYAFTHDQAGKITVSASINNKHITISIGDDGTGIPESVNIETSEGFGFTLVNMLSEQLEAKIQIERKNGTKFIFTFDA